MSERILTLSIAVVNLPVILLHIFPDKPPDACGSSAITVLSPMLEISLSCSLSETIFVHKDSTINST